MAGILIAERLYEEEDRGGGPSRYVLYAAAAAAALVGAWVIAAPSIGSSPAPEALVVDMTPSSTRNIREIDMTAPSAPVVAPSAATEPIVAPEAAAPRIEAAADPAPIPPKPVPRPVRSVASAPATPVVRNRVVEADAAPITQTGTPPSDLGVLYEPAARNPAYEPVYVPATPAATYEPAGPVPPMPIDAQVDSLPPPGTPTRHQGLLGAGEQAAGTVWNWSTGAVNGVVRGVQNAF